jgi:hypothetical protein
MHLFKPLEIKWLPIKDATLLVILREAGRGGKVIHLEVAVYSQVLEDTGVF